jgi:hypothetical protein
VLGLAAFAEAVQKCEDVFRGDLVDETITDSWINLSMMP